MIPILYEYNETSFTTEGIGRLTDCLECRVTEERNGIYECEFTYPVDGIRYSEIQEGRIISVIHDDSKTQQPFDIYGRSAPLNGVVTFYAHHISYRLGNVVLRPFTAANVALALSLFQQYSMTGNPFTFWTDKSDTGEFKIVYPRSIREVLGGSDGSILDTFNGGEYEFDKFDVKLYANRGTDTQVEIRYGKNLSDLKHDIDISGSYNAVAPYYKSGDDDVVVPGSIVISSYVQPESTVLTTNTGANITTNTGADIELYTADYVVAPLDLSSEFESRPTGAQLTSKATEWMQKNKPWLPSENITVDFVALWQIPGYEDFTSLQRVKLCDTVSVIYPELGVNAVRQKVIKVVYDVLNERYSSIELGMTEKSLAQTIQVTTQKMLEQVATQSMLAAAIEAATDKINGGRGGHVIMNTDADGNPDEILIMDTDNPNTAVSVIRMNKNGIGFSQNGYQGPFRSAWTIDGKFNADFITVGNLNANLIQTGTMLANRIFGGTLTLGGARNGNGTLVVKNASDDVIGRWNNTGITLSRGKLQSQSGLIYFDLTNNELGCNCITNSESGYHDAEILFDAAASFNDNYWGWRFCRSNRNLGVVVSPTTSSGNANTIIADRCPLNITRTGMKSGIYISNNGYLGLYGGDVNASISESRVENYNIGAGCSITLGPFDNNTKNIRIKGYVAGEEFTLTKLTVSGTKSRIVSTEDYGDRLLYCYETASPMFGDVGEGVIAEDGNCYVYIDPVFSKAVTLGQYQVFLQAYGDDNCYVSEKAPAYFVVSGAPGLSFGWEIKAKQSDFDQIRMEKQIGKADIETVDYGALGADYYKELQGGRL